MQKRLLFSGIKIITLLISINSSYAFPGLTIEHFFPDDYRFALWEWKAIEHVIVTGPGSFQLESQIANISLPNKPIIGGTYTFDIKYKDGSSEIWDYTVNSVNSNFANIISPEYDEVMSTTPTFIWSEATGISEYFISINGEIADGTYGNLWIKSLPVGTTSCTYNFDGTATESLQIGKSYGIVLSTTDLNGHVAVVMKDIFISGPCSEIVTSRKYRMEFQYDTSYYNAQKVWLPIPHSWDGNGLKTLNIINIIPTPNNRYYDPNGTGTEIAYWELSDGSTDKIKIIFNVELSLIRHCIDEKRTWPPYNKNTEFYQKNTSPTSWVQSNHPDIVNAAKSIIGEETNPYKQARLLFNYVNTEIEGLPLDGPPQPDGDALLVLQRGTAGCGGFANFFVALCRAVGIPARNIGVWTPPMDPTGQKFFEEGVHCYDCPNYGFGTHVMAEFYLQDYGWVQCDPSQGGTPIQFGNIPNERLYMSKGNEIELLNGHFCPDDAAHGNGIDGVHAWFHMPRIPCQDFFGMTLRIRKIKDAMPWRRLLLLND